MYDWLNIALDPDDPSSVTPCKLASVIVHEEKSENEWYELVVQKCSEKTGRDSALFTEWEWNEEMLIVATKQVVSPSFVVVVSETEDSCIVMEALPIQKWAHQFTRDFSRPPEDDSDEEEGWET